MQFSKLPECHSNKRHIMISAKTFNNTTNDEKTHTVNLNLTEYNPIATLEESNIKTIRQDDICQRKAISKILIDTLRSWINVSK